MPTHLVIVVALLALAPKPARAESSGALGADKPLHLAVGGAVAMFGYALAAQILDGPGPRSAIGGGLALAAGVGKEVWDLLGEGTAEWLDLAFGVLGAGLGLLVAVAVDLAFEHRRRQRRTLAALAQGPD